MAEFAGTLVLLEVKTCSLVKRRLVWEESNYRIVWIGISEDPFLLTPSLTGNDIEL